MEITFGRIASLLLGIAYVTFAAVSGQGWPFAVTVAVGVLLLLSLIWFPDEIESWSRMWRRGGLTGLEMRPSPSRLVATMGWVLLLGFPLGVLLQYLSK
ncbi:MAG TPA: hypothetical protein VGJ05_00425 [Fimbriiglobus sp.]|jgi:hypothetical protein